MSINRVYVSALCIFLLTVSYVDAQELKPMASSYDITSKLIENDNTENNKVSENSNREAKNKASKEEKKLNKKEKKEQQKLAKKEKDNKNKIKEPINEDIANQEDAITENESAQDSTGQVNSIDTANQELEQVEEAVEMKNDNIQEDITAGEEQVDNVLPTYDPTIINKTKAHDSDIKKQAEIVELELRGEEKHALRDLRILWSAAVEKSTTIRLAIQKLSNPDESDKIKQSNLTKFLSPLASIAPMAMMASSSAAQTAGALVGGSMLGTLSSDVDNNYNRAFLHVSDFDLIMLAKAIDELQARLVVVYYEYVHSIERLEEAEQALQNAEKLNNEVKDSGNFAAITASNAFYNEAKQNHMTAKHNFLSSRTALEQLTGNNAIVYIETNTEIDDEADPSAAIKPETTQNIDNEQKEPAQLGAVK